MSIIYTLHKVGKYRKKEFEMKAHLFVENRHFQRAFMLEIEQKIIKSEKNKTNKCTFANNLAASKFKAIKNFVKISS